MGIAVRFGAGLAIGLLIWLTLPWVWPRAEPFPPPAPELIDDEALSVADFRALSQWARQATPQQFEQALARLDPHRLMRDEIAVQGGEAELRDRLGLPLARVPLRPQQEGPLHPLSSAQPQRHDVTPSKARSPSRPNRVRSSNGVSLRGLRILLDPGHFGGSWSEVESRHLVLNGGPVLREGHINWGVGLLLRDHLRRAGAEVVMSRRAPPTEPWLEPPAEAMRSPDTLGAWLARTYPGRMTTAWLLANPAQLEQLWISGLSVRVPPPPSPANKRSKPRTFFDEYNRFDFRRRSRMTETVRPHLTLSLHHNIAAQKDLNRVVVFVPGMVLPSENNAATRFYVFRRALSGDGPLLERLALTTSRHMQRKLGLPASQHATSSHPKTLPIFPNNGVFARNLAMLRRAVGPVLLLEGPCMNYPSEYERLTAQDFQLEGAWYPNRIRPYAEAAFQAIVAHRDELIASSPSGGG